jgi:hypothetical protein
LQNAEPNDAAKQTGCLRANIRTPWARNY